MNSNQTYKKKIALMKEQNFLNEYIITQLEERVEADSIKSSTLLERIDELEEENNKLKDLKSNTGPITTDMIKELITKCKALEKENNELNEKFQNKFFLPSEHYNPKVGEELCDMDNYFYKQGYDWSWAEAPPNGKQFDIIYVFIKDEELDEESDEESDEEEEEEEVQKKTKRGARNLEFLNPQVVYE